MRTTLSLPAGILLLSTLVAASPAPQASATSASSGLAAFPSCAQSCLASAVASSSCGTTDYECQCTSQLQSITSASTSCLLTSSCSAGELVEVQSAASAQCSSVLAAVSASGGASSGSAAAATASSVISSAASSAKSVEATASGSSTGSAKSTGSSSSASATSSTAAASTGGAAVGVKVQGVGAVIGAGVLALFAL